MRSILHCLILSVYWVPATSFLSLSEARRSFQPRYFESLESSDLPFTADPNDDIFRSMTTTLPTSWLHFARDAGIFRILADTLVLFGIPALMKEYPQALPNFLALSNSGRKTDHVPHSTTLTTLSYGSHPQQTMTVLETDEPNDEARVVLFAHGGAWGSGKPWMYRLAAIPFFNYTNRVAIWGYRTYPDGTVQDQMQDLQSAINLLKQKYSPKHVTIIGHSSGAHVAVLTALTAQERLCHDVVAISGVYDIADHYDWEYGRGVHEISAMKPACGGVMAQWNHFSPTRRIATAQSVVMPNFYVLHGAKDTVVPYTSALNFTRAMKQNGFECELDILPMVEHAETVLHLMMGGETRDKVMDWLLRERYYR